MYESTWKYGELELFFPHPPEYKNKHKEHHDPITMTTATTFTIVNTSTITPSGLLMSHESARGWEIIKVSRVKSGRVRSCGV